MLLDGQAVELGVGPHGEFGRDVMGVGTSGYVSAQVLAPGAVKDWGGVDLIARGSGTDFFSYAGTGKPFDDVLVEGSAGVRASYQYNPTLIIGAEALGGYEQRTGALSERLVFGSVGLPVAEAATPDLWVYTDITLGIAVPFDIGHGCSGAPFCGFQEIPLGVVWRVTPWLLVSAEGGLSLPVNGGYGGVSAMFRL